MLYNLTFPEETNDNILLCFLSIFFVCIDTYFEKRLCWICFLEICYFYILHHKYFCTLFNVFPQDHFSWPCVTCMVETILQISNSWPCRLPIQFLYYQLCCNDILRNTSFPTFMTIFLEIELLSQTNNKPFLSPLIAITSLPSDKSKQQLPSGTRIALQNCPELGWDA